MIPKFRIFDKKKKRFLDNFTMEIDRYGIHVLDEFNYVVDEDDRVLMQSTGLHDKNGKEIFEGDILEIKGHPFQRHTGEMSGMPVGIDIDGRYVIEYNQENAGYVVGNWKTREVVHYCTVIGNIHEHSHLLDDGGYRE